MPSGRPDRIFLVGLSGSGKSTVAALIARRLGWDTADTDAMIEHAAGQSIPEIFRDEGEASFRERERAALQSLAGLDHLVVATGGGAILTPESRRAVASGFVVWLAVSPAGAASRLHATAHGRPLLEGGAEERLTALLDARARYYELADVAVDVDGLKPDEVAARVVSLWEQANLDGDYLPARLEPATAAGDEARELTDVAATVSTPGGNYPVVVAEGALARLGSVCRSVGLDGRAFIVTDGAVGPRFAADAASALSSAGYEARAITVPAGEAYKTLATVQLVYDRLIDARAERSDFVVCVGGGVITDLGGFAAATYLRGVDFVHVPTSLLAMVDAAIGGKTGVDHPRAKNMIGAFAQPRAVVIDPLLLQTLPQRELRAGWAEVIKHALILDSALVDDLERAASRTESMMSSDLITRSVAIKAAVVSEDEREAGRRTLLNYGHTIGHAIEAVTGYSAWLHGEAVAVGMHAAGIISREMGLLAPADLDRQQALIDAFGLPCSAPGLPVDAILDATLLDKKVRGGSVRWVLLEGIGHAVVRQDVPSGLVRHAVETIL